MNIAKGLQTPSREGFEFGFTKSLALNMNSGLPGDPRKAGRRSCGVDTVDWVTYEFLN